MILGMVLVLSIGLNGGLMWLLVRASRRLLQFDDLWERAAGVLFDYSDDLQVMLSSDLLTDNPEVLAFHRRNKAALEQLRVAAESFGGRRRGDPGPAGPRPDAE